MSLDEYESEQKASLNTLSLCYASKDNASKWDLLLNKFKELDSQRLNQYLAFQQDRKNVIENIYNLSLADCVMYFENFYFLYTTEDPRFKLNSTQKKQLLESIDDAMCTCETGIRTRFENVLQLYRTDLDWVRNTLSHARFLLITKISAMYNSTNNVAVALSPHVLSIMTKLANQCGLGIRIEREIHDIYQHSLGNISPIIEFFNQSYPVLFSKNYEEELDTILTVELLQKVKDSFFKGCPEIGPTLCGNKISAFNTFLENHIGSDVSDIVTKLGELNESYTELHLKDKESLTLIIKELINQKLIREGYCLPAEQLSAVTIQQELRLSNGLYRKKLTKFNEALIDCNEANIHNIARIIMQHRIMIIQYPSILLSRIQEHPELISVLPNEFKNNRYFIEPVVKILENALLAAMDAGNTRHINQFTSDLLYLAQQNASYLANISTRILNLPDVALTLLKKDGLYLKHLPIEMRQDRTLVEAAILQNSQAWHYIPPNLALDYIQLAQQTDQTEPSNSIMDYYTKIFLTKFFHPKSALDPKIQSLLLKVRYNDGKDTLIKGINQISAVYKLLEPQQLSSLTVARLAQHITPAILIEIINCRQSNNLQPLPYCQDTSIIEEFNTSLTAFDIDDWSKGYDFIKQEAYIRAQGCLKINHQYNLGIIGHLIKTDSWYIAMLQHQRSKHSFWLELNRIFYPLFSILSSMSTLISVSCLGIYLSNLLLFIQIIDLLPLMISPYISMLFLISSASSLLLFLTYRVHPNIMSHTIIRHLFLTSCILSVLGLVVFSPDFVISFALLLIIKQQVSQIFENMEALILNLRNTRIFNSIFSSTEQGLITSNSNLRTKCEESIIRLKLIDDPIAQEKAEVLELIWNEINTDIKDHFGQIPEAEQEAILASCLNKKYSIFYHAKREELSFYQVASINRAFTSRLELPKTGADQTFRFFKNVTMKILPEPMQEMTATI